MPTLGALAAGPRDNASKLLRAISFARLGFYGRIVFTRDLYGIFPYLDPAKLLSREQIEWAAKKAQVPAGKIAETVRSLSEHMGWDITKGGRLISPRSRFAAAPLP